MMTSDSSDRVAHSAPPLMLPADVLEGGLDLLCFEPLDRTVGDWHHWRDRSGRTHLRGGSGAFLYVPPGVPHAFVNPGRDPARMFFRSSVHAG